MVHDHGTLVVGPLAPPVFAIAQGTAADHHARLVAASPTDLPLRAAGRFQEMNFGLAAAAAEAFLGQPLDERALREAASATVVPGRLEAVGERPLTLFDGAHNPSGAARARRLAAQGVRITAAARRGRRRPGGQGRGRDARVAASPAGSRGLHAPHEPALALTRDPRDARREARRPAGGDRGEPQAALARARELAGADGAVLATGSIYLIADLVREDADARASTL